MNSIFHFFREIYLQRNLFILPQPLENFPFPQNLLSCINKGTFPDMAIKLNKNQKMFSGGELIELKDSDNYTVSSFNSTIPTGSKNILNVIGTGKSKIRKQMEEAGDNILSLPVRDVFYLLCGRKAGLMKVALVNGDFFETVKTKDLLRSYFSYVINKKIKNLRMEISPEVRKILFDFFSEQENFSRVREVENASVKLRFRIMTEVKAEGNILNSQQYPSILDNTLNFILPKHDQSDQTLTESKMKKVFSEKELKTFKTFDIKHHFNGYFRVYQTVIG